VAEYSRLLARLSGLEEYEADLIAMASPMHDIGKVGIPDSILNKPHRLSKREFEIMKSHTEIGYELLSNSNRKILKAAATVAHEHHEKWDGSGYPKGLEGDKIHIYGRITALADVFDALGPERWYKKAWADEDIFILLREQSGKHFDPSLIEMFFSNIDDFFSIRTQYRDDLSDT